ncbi:hypothetical protein D9M69_519520 [compost metagenome]
MLNGLVLLSPGQVPFPPKRVMPTFPMSTLIEGAVSEHDRVLALIELILTIDSG